MTVEYRRMDGRGRKKSPERRCKAPSRDEVVPGHLRAEHRNRSGPSARRPSPSGPPPTRRGTDHFARGARLALSPGTSVGSWAAVVAGGSLRAPPQPLARHSRRGTRPGKLTSEACLTVKYRRTDGRRQKRSPEPRCKTPPRDEAVSGGDTPALSAEIASGPSGLRPRPTTNTTRYRSLCPRWRLPSSPGTSLAAAPTLSRANQPGGRSAVQQSIHLSTIHESPPSRSPLVLRRLLG